MIISHNIDIVFEKKVIRQEDLLGPSPQLTGTDDFASLLFLLQKNDFTPFKINLDKKSSATLVFSALLKRFISAPNKEVAVGFSVVLIPTMPTIGQIKDVTIIPRWKDQVQLLSTSPDKVIMEVGPNKHKILFRIEILFKCPEGKNGEEKIRNNIIPPKYFIV